jgi:hypothetical protein
MSLTAALVATAASPAAVLCAIGIISPPEFRARRDAIRRTWLSSVSHSMIVKFAVRSKTESCSNGQRSAASTASASVEEIDDVVPLRSVCVNEPRKRGAVLSIWAWLQHATVAYASAHFIAKTDDDAWLDVAALRRYLVVVARNGSSHVLLGTMYFTSWIQDGDGLHEKDGSFGHTCHQAVSSYKTRVEPGLRDALLNPQNATSAGPFVFTPGYLTVLSSPLALMLTASSRLHDNLQRIQSQGGSFGLEDKWLGSAMQRHAQVPIQFVNLYHSGLMADAYGVQVRSTTLLWHNRVKAPERIDLLHNFSARYGCLAPDWLGDAHQPVLTCIVEEKSPCAPANSSWCTLSALCEPREYQLNLSSIPYSWTLCAKMKGRQCVRDHR